MSNRPTLSQLESLVEFLEQNPGIAKGLLRTTQAKLETKRKWASLATSLNSLGGVIKDGQGWAKYWAEKKCALKKQCAEHALSMRRTGGGTPDNLPTLSALDERLVAIMGGQVFATGNSELAVNPFPESTRSAVSPVVIEVHREQDTEMRFEHTIRVSPVSGTSQNETIEATASSAIPVPTPLPNTNTPPRQRRRPSTRGPDAVSMERFARIEERRVEAEFITAQALAQLSEQFGNMTAALTSIANAITEVARKMPDS